MANPATLADLRSYVQAGLRRIGKEFTAPADDWPQVLFVQDERGVEVVHLADEMFKNGIRKEMLGEMIRLRMVATGVYRYALLINTHGVHLDQDDPRIERLGREEVRIEQLEGATEQLVLTIGDAETEELWFAPIIRTPRMLRTLAPWENLSADPDASFEGRFWGLNEYLRLPKKDPA